MLCQRCGERDATIHEVLIDSAGVKHEHHICEVCAAQNTGAMGSDVSGVEPVAEMLGKFMVGGGNEPTGSLSGPVPTGPGRAGPGIVCPSCGLTWAHFKQTSLLGCGQCYEAFAGRLGPLVERAHEGGSNHVGKVPTRALAESDRREALLGDEAARTRKLADLTNRLEAAVTAERYELAASLKQELERVRMTGEEITEPTGDGEGSDG